MLLIRKNVDCSKWRYCKTKENPADIITRANKNFDKNLWWNGPSFLRDVNSFYSYATTIHDDSPLEEEIKTDGKTSTCANIVLENYSIAKIIDVNKFNDVLKLFRVTAFVLRFIKNVKKKIKKKEIILKSHVTTIEMSEAKLLWLRDNQSQLKQSKNYLEIKNTLNLHEDDNTLIRSYSRLKNAKIPFDSKAPIMLDRNHKLTELLILYSHLKVLHRGVKQTLTEFRQQYWITRGRSCVKKVIHPCIICKKLNGRPYLYPQHSDIPEFRFDDITPFHSVGVDYLGPLMCLPVYDVKVKLYKAWVVIYTCASTRAIILDVVHNYHSSTFINCLKRFIAKRGCPSTVISDNGKTFISEDTQTFLSNHFINWNFNVEKDPWWGGM